MAAVPVFRPTARIIVSDNLDRILLFSYTDAEGKTGWFTPGGGMHNGETAVAAATRELAEETGLVLAESDVGLIVATCSGIWTATDGTRYFGADSFFFARVADTLVRTDGQEALEASIITDYRWWDAAELTRTTDGLVPAGLAELVAQLIASGPPERAVRLPWRSAPAARALRLDVTAGRLRLGVTGRGSRGACRPARRGTRARPARCRERPPRRRGRAPTR
jgi:8-oxo-dGTP pyrophosphatase MutT (NUDIX family)